MGFGKIINNIILCIRFPFLYPRDISTNKHYTNWKIREKQKKIFSKWWEYAQENKNKYLKKFGPECTFLNGEYIKPSYIMKLVPLRYKFVYNFYKWYESFLGLFHCIPTYTLLDEMPKGWRKAFGIQMCKKMAKQLRKEGHLYKCRILQIKEKYGELRWYMEGISSNVSHIIEDYTITSQHTCINCGKPAKWLSIGWISPYCDDCKVEGNKYDSIYNDEETNMCNK